MRPRVRLREGGTTVSIERGAGDWGVPCKHASGEDETYADDKLVPEFWGAQLLAGFIGGRRGTRGREKGGGGAVCGGEEGEKDQEEHDE